MLIKTKQSYSHQHSRDMLVRESETAVEHSAVTGRLFASARQLAAAVAAACCVAAIAPAQAAPFETCPSKAFLIQQTHATLYGVNLATGYYSELSADLGTTDKINALAFNFHDDYLYGWGYEFGAPIRIDSNYQSTPLEVDDLPGINFYVGDIAVDHNAYYVYRSGTDYGLYRINLDAPAGSKLKAERVVDGQALKMQIYDLAFHPTNGFAYAVDRSGTLFEIDVQSGAARDLANVGASGTFGAAYFDVDGYMYISRNSDGYVFRIAISDAVPSAEFYAYGPSSSNNDGARCAMAPIVSETDTDIDFGDAPDSYGTSLGSNGARHDIGTSTVFLGQQVDGESDAFMAPLSDDTADRVDDEDGIQFITGLEVGERAILIVEASERAYLNAWVDWNQNGVFDSDERIVSQEFLSSGQNYVVINTPLWATAGSTWARFRLSSTADVEPTGGVSDGEVEDYEVSVTAPGVTETTYPSAGSWSTVAYEDNWPVQGDYDMNDLVVNLRMRELTRDDQVLGIEISGELVAVGGVYHNGFAIRLPGISTNALANDGIQFWINNRVQSVSPLESEQGEIILVMTDDAWKYVSPGEGCAFYRTQRGCESAVQMTFKVRVSFGAAGAPASTFPAAPYDPFMFATPGYFHGDLFAEPPGRGLEVHLPGQTPTDLFNTAFLGLGQDRSNPDNDEYFRSDTGMPWALQIGNEWQYPLEFKDITDAYPLFETYVTSSGVDSKNWYLPDNADQDLVFITE